MRCQIVAYAGEVGVLYCTVEGREQERTPCRRMRSTLGMISGIAICTYALQLYDKRGCGGLAFTLKVVVHNGSHLVRSRDITQVLGYAIEAEFSSPCKSNYQKDSEGGLQV